MAISINVRSSRQDMMVLKATPHRRSTTFQEALLLAFFNSRCGVAFPMFAGDISPRLGRAVFSAVRFTSHEFFTSFACGVHAPHQHIAASGSTLQNNTTCSGSDVTTPSHLVPPLHTTPQLDHEPPTEKQEETSDRRH